MSRRSVRPRGNDIVFSQSVSHEVSASLRLAHSDRTGLHELTLPSGGGPQAGPPIPPRMSITTSDSERAADRGERLFAGAPAPVTDRHRRAARSTRRPH